MYEEFIILAVSGAIAVIAFFLKRTIGDVDECKTEIDSVKENYTKKEVMEKFDRDISRNLEQIGKDLKEVQINYIPKDDFYNEMAKIDKKMDRITDLILDNMKGKCNDK